MGLNRASVKTVEDWIDLGCLRGTYEHRESIAMLAFSLAEEIPLSEDESRVLDALLDDDVCMGMLAELEGLLKNANAVAAPARALPLSSRRVAIGEFTTGSDSDSSAHQVRPASWLPWAVAAAACILAVISLILAGRTVGTAREKRPAIAPYQEGSAETDGRTWTSRRPAGKRTGSANPSRSREAEPISATDAATAGSSGVVVVEETTGTGTGEQQPASSGEPTPAQRRRSPRRGGETLLGKAAVDRERSADLAAEAMTALREGHTAKATSLFNQAIAFDRKNSKALMGLSDIYFANGSNRKAVDYAEKAVAASPRSARSRIKLGDAYFKVLRYADAKQQYLTAKALGSKQASQRLEKVAAKRGE